MGNLEKVVQLKQQGQTDSQIIGNLKQQGVSPKEIEEVLSQSQIKSAFNEQGAAPQQAPPALKSTQEISAQSPPQTTPQLAKITEPAPMQPSMMQSAPEALPQKTQQPLSYPQATQATQQMQEPQPTFQQSSLPIPAPFQEAPEPGYPPEYQYSEYQPQQIGDIETINEIAEQILDEKTTQLKKQITSFTGFTEEATSNIERLNERLFKIENTLNELQVAILRKVGDYGKDIQNIAKEMHSTQDSFSKILNPLTDNIRELKKITGSTTPKPSKPKPEPEPKKPKPEPSKPKPKTKSHKTKSRKKKTKTNT